jgi:hypothetical protein
MFTQQQCSSRETFSLRACRKEAQGNAVDVDSSAQENVQNKHSIPAYMYIAFNKPHQTNIRQKLFTNLLCLNMKETAGIFNDLGLQNSTA